MCHDKIHFKSGAQNSETFSAPRSCVSPDGRFVWAVHRPDFQVANLRQEDAYGPLGTLPDGSVVDNFRNFPDGDVNESAATPIIEISGIFPFRGATFIGTAWAERKAENPATIRLPAQPAVSMTETLLRMLPEEAQNDEGITAAFSQLPYPVLLTLATTSTDPRDLKRLASLSCQIQHDTDGKPTGLGFGRDSHGRIKPVFRNEPLFESLVNNPYLPNEYKDIMVLRPGVQGDSEIVGEWRNGEGTHIFEYLRRNSYIPWGHYAANFANDSVRYRFSDVSCEDMRGLRHLYYQRTIVRLASELGVAQPVRRRPLCEDELEALRLTVLEAVKCAPEGTLRFTATLWGWNFGFDFAASGYRLHASHQQVHQQFALIPAIVQSDNGSILPSYNCGDQISCFARNYREVTGSSFFASYLAAIINNTRMDGRADRPQSLVVWEDEHVLLFVPKAQTSQWELQLMTKAQVGNILEADTATRSSLDHGIRTALTALTRLGARMVSSIEYPKRFDTSDRDQRLLYCFLPKLPQSMGAFSEAQHRYIMGHYPEDFAAAARSRLYSRGQSDY